jgi:hypothetical protein
VRTCGWREFDGERARWTLTNSALGRRSGVHRHPDRSRDGFGRWLASGLLVSLTLPVVWSAVSGVTIFLVAAVWSLTGPSRWVGAHHPEREDAQQEEEEPAVAHRSPRREVGVVWRVGSSVVPKVVRAHRLERRPEGPTADRLEEPRPATAPRQVAGIVEEDAQRVKTATEHRSHHEEHPPGAERREGPARQHDGGVERRPPHQPGLGACTR